MTDEQFVALHDQMGFALLCEQRDRAHAGELRLSAEGWYKLIRATGGSEREALDAANAAMEAEEARKQKQAGADWP